MKRLFRKRTLIKLSLWFKRRFSPHDFQKITKTERDALSIFNLLVHDSESELLIKPSNDKFYVKSTKTGIFITLLIPGLSNNSAEISIINHIYSYNVKINSRVAKNMEATFIKEVEKRRLIMENEYKNNIQYSLHHIANTIKERL